jgi:acyl-CoA synthetase (AMP-forming)/AMP-acid ligase II
VVCNQLAERRVLGTIGALAPHTQVRIVDPATGREVPAGEEGVLKGERRCHFESLLKHG